MHPLTAVIPSAVAELLRRAPFSQAKVAFAWNAVVGARLQRVTSVWLQDDVLTVRVTDARWARAISRSIPIIQPRLQTLLGDGVVKRIEVVTP